jgi:hypothetical protein
MDPKTQTEVQSKVEAVQVLTDAQLEWVAGGGVGSGGTGGGPTAGAGNGGSAFA